MTKTFLVQGIPWQSTGQDSLLSLPWAQVQFLVKELRSHKPYRVAKKKKKFLTQLEDTRTRTGCELLLRIMGDRCDSGEEEDVLILRGRLLKD